MKHLLATLFVLLVAMSAYAQEQTQKSEIVIKHETEYSSFYAVRFGFWFPKDKEQSWSLNNLSTSQAQENINQSQAFGLDFHFRREVSKPLSFDFALQIWYTTYEVKFNQLLNNPDTLHNISSWTVLIPITAGASFAIIPSGPFRPYLMAGIGPYIGISGLERTTYGDKTTHDKSLVKVAFGGFIGAGFDLMLSEKFGFSVAGKYTLVNFPERLYTQQQDFSGVQLMVGFATAM
jgi:opacity protein-like surface antigen